jgi:hypothetical protein
MNGGRGASFYLLPVRTSEPCLQKIIEFLKLQRIKKKKINALLENAGYIYIYMFNPNRDSTFSVLCRLASELNRIVVSVILDDIQAGVC